MTQAYDRLKALLEELFQFDREDLDFGIYRIMNHKRDEVSKFLDDDLLPQVKQAFAEYRGEEAEGARRELAALAKTLGDAGVSAESSPKYVALKEKVAGSDNVEALENEVYSDLYTFFRRYYKNGDFLSLRRYREGVYALPYEGEEVKLHWANADQFYVKTAENFRRYRFTPKSGGSVAFELVAADTERDNNKAAGGRERRFVLREGEPVEERDGGLRVSFEYRSHLGKQADLNRSAVATILDRAPGEWKTILSERMPTPSNPDRTVLEKHLDEYTARNTFDYFIHKDLGRFLNRELDFFLKNEVLRVDDLDTGDERRVGQYLSKLRVMKRIGRKIVAFLAQIEDFQKKLFQKKKFVVHSGYCLTLDNISEDLYPEIAANDAQYEEWESLFSISGIEANLENGGDERTVAWLKANPFLVLDTKHFDDDFEDRLLASIEDLDEKTDGLLVESENFQALNLLQARYRERVKCIYIDPPYNTGGDGFLYKDQYQHSSWLSMMEDRLRDGRMCLAESGVMFVSIDDNEQATLKGLMDSVFQTQNFIASVIWHKVYAAKNTARYFSEDHDYLLVYANNAEAWHPNLFERTEKQTQDFTNPDSDERGPWQSVALSARNPYSKGLYPVTTPSGSTIAGPPRGRYWTVSEEKLRELDDDGRIWWGPNGDRTPRRKNFLSEVKQGIVPRTIWSYEQAGHTQDAKKELMSLINFEEASSIFSTPKPVKLLRRVTQVATDNDSTVMDFFAGSGTTGHAVINLNREDGGNRKYVLVEMGEYFASVLKPRILKVIYSKDWRDGKPVSREGVGHVLKYLRLESYEDTLNNLSLRRTGVQDGLISSNDALREAYTLRYMMDFETKGSPSLLDLDAFEDPFSYTLEVARGDETRKETVDLVETFNYLLGLTVLRLYSADGFRVVEGTDPSGDEVLVIWRNTHEKSDDDLNAFFDARGFAERSFDRVYTNGDNTLALKIGDGGPSVHLIEEEFRRLMFESNGV